MFKTAYQVGKSKAADYLKEHRQEHQNIEESIFVLMASNPYKGEKQRRAYVDGVSEWVNMVGRIEQRKASGPDAGLKHYS